MVYISKYFSYSNFIVLSLHSYYKISNKVILGYIYIYEEHFQMNIYGFMTLFISQYAPFIDSIEMFLCQNFMSNPNRPNISTKYYILLK